MGIAKTLIIDGKEVAFRASAASPRLYRKKFQRDLIKDFAELRKNYNKVVKSRKKFEEMTDEEREDVQLEQLSVIDLEVFENLAYIMAWQADPNIPAGVGEWLDQFDTFSIYQIFPELSRLWAQNNQTLDKPKNV